MKLISNETEAAEAVRNILSGRHLLQEQRGRASQQQASYPETLQRSAEQILAGVKRPTAVESAAALQFVTGELGISILIYRLMTGDCPQMKLTTRSI